MIVRTILLLSMFALAACSKQEDDAPQPPAPATPEPAEAATDEIPDGSMALAPGLTARILVEGQGAGAEAGQIAVVHYTGWLYDETLENNRGKKFDSSVDRDEYFSFMLGGGRVIKGWDQGVVGMKVGEIRELTIMPFMAYGDRGAGDVIPPGAKLVFEIELAELQGTSRD